VLWPAPAAGNGVVQLLIALLPFFSTGGVPSRQLAEDECHVDLLIKGLIFGRLDLREKQLVRKTAAEAIAAAAGQVTDDILSLANEPGLVTLTSGEASNDRAVRPWLPDSWPAANAQTGTAVFSLVQGVTTTTQLRILRHSLQSQPFKTRLIDGITGLQGQIPISDAIEGYMELLTINVKPSIPFSTTARPVDKGGQTDDETWHPWAPRSGDSTVDVPGSKVKIPLPAVWLLLFIVVIVATTVLCRMWYDHTHPKEESWGVMSTVIAPQREPTQWEKMQDRIARTRNSVTGLMRNPRLPIPRGSYSGAGPGFGMKQGH